MSRDGTLYYSREISATSEANNALKPTAAAPVSRVARRVGRAAAAAYGARWASQWL